MTYLDEATSARLERLRATDTVGIYASDQPSDGRDPAGALTVTVDPTNRVQHVHVSEVELLRTTTALTIAFDAAYSQALEARITRGTTIDTTKPRPSVKRTRLQLRPVTAKMLNRHQTRRVYAGQRPARRWGPQIGVSENDCLSVTLTPSGSSGTVAADPAWLQNTSGSNLAAAIIQAFTTAYARRDES